MNYYNENDPFLAAWLRELMKDGLIAGGIIDERSIIDVESTDLTAFKQCHFFAGIGGWSYALRLAGWPDNEPVWTGSCPCQPFSQAGKGLGKADRRHLWPFLRNIIGECRPSVVFGEQVAGAAGRLWLAGVRFEMEKLGYAFGGADLCAAGISAPHVRQRLYWVANSNSAGRPWQRSAQSKRRNGDIVPAGNGSHSGLGNSNRYHEHWWSGPLQAGWNCIAGEITRSGRKQSSQWRIKPGLSILANGIPNRVGQLCGFGNAIIPQLAAEFIQAACECHDGK